MMTLVRNHYKFFPLEGEDLTSSF